MKPLFTSISFVFVFSMHGQLILPQVHNLENQKNYSEAYHFLFQNVDSAECYPCEKELSVLAYKSGLLLPAIDHATASTKIDSNDVDSWLVFTQANEKRRNTKAAVSGAEKLIELSPKVAFYQKLAGGLYLQSNQPAEAIIAFSNTLELNPQDEEAGYSLCRLLYKLEMYEQAEYWALKFLKADSLHSGFLAILPKIYYQQKKYTKAKRASVNLMAIGDTSTETTKILAVSLVKTKAYDSALIALNYLQKHKQMSAALYFQKAYAYEQLGEIDSAEYNYNKALKTSISPNAGQYHLRLALVFDGQKKYEQAIPHYKEAHKLLQDETILYYLARTYDNSYSDKTVAMNFYQRYLEESDTITTPSKTYASERISQIKEVMHMKLDSL